MSEEEKKAKKFFEEIIQNFEDYRAKYGKKIVLPCNYEIVEKFFIISNLIEKQQKEIEELKDIEADYIRRRKTCNAVLLKQGYISKDKIRELKQSIHNTLDENGITRGYQQIIDKYFDELLEEE